ncbi:alpha/beta hydrolase [Aquincola sp. S2]|uniref:Alpha/beta hydrolase n=1 Tax=Pseudaquabacterium terrae TaxID=2732868 RepID=A0ABX2EGE9_9BURK|nr:alpha/beta hydrolase [Aquabacterium terrae]NRF67661.1 alpha/beta hydrolase [Aquabacterium terrae]
MTEDPTSSAPPKLIYLLLEARAGAELAASLAAWPWLQFGPRGDGHPVLVLPGLLASDRSSLLLRRYLASRGHDVHGWGLGRNFGARGNVRNALLERLDELHARSGRKVSLVGWSLGGMFARFLAKERPDAVRQVITLGSPIAGDPRANRAWRVYQLVSGRRADDKPLRARIIAEPTVPTTSIYSRSDGIVAWRCSVQRESAITENIEVVSSHVGLGMHPVVLHALADRLAQPEGAWQPFERRGLRALVYPRAAAFQSR